MHASRPRKITPTSPLGSMPQVQCCELCYAANSKMSSLMSVPMFMMQCCTILCDLEAWKLVSLSISLSSGNLRIVHSDGYYKILCTCTTLASDIRCNTVLLRTFGGTEGKKSTSIDAVLWSRSLDEEHIILSRVEIVKLMLYAVNCLITLPYFIEVLPCIF